MRLAETPFARYLASPFGEGVTPTVVAVICCLGMTPRALHPFSSPGDTVVHSCVAAMVKKVSCLLATQ